MRASIARIAIFTQTECYARRIGIPCLFHCAHICIFDVLYSLSCQPECVVSVFRSGAWGIFYRIHSLKELSKCIQVVHRGQIWAGNEDIEHMLTALIDTKPLQFNNADGMPLLTRREEDVVRLAADGLKNREIAQKLKVKEHSVRNCLYRIFEKLGVSIRVELILYALSQRDRNN